MRHNFLLCSAVVLLVIFVVQQTESAPAGEVVSAKPQGKTGKKVTGTVKKGSKKAAGEKKQAAKNLRRGKSTTVAAEITANDNLKTQKPQKSKAAKAKNAYVRVGTSVAPRVTKVEKLTSTDSEKRIADVEAETKPTPNASDSASSEAVTTENAEAADIRRSEEEMDRIKAEMEREREEYERENPPTPAYNPFEGIPIGGFFGGFANSGSESKPLQQE